MKRRILSIITALALCLSLFTPALAAAGISYLDENGVTRTISAADEVTADDTEWGGDSTGEVWYIARGNITIDGRVTVKNHVHLILATGYTLTVNGGIGVSAGNSLTIYAQSTGDDMGALKATDTGTAASGNNAAIGGSVMTAGDGTITGDGSCGTITINGGRVKATNSYDGAGIGGGVNGSGGIITINGGIVEASGYSGAGIGGGVNGSGGTITINGGTVTATGNRKGAGIGGGSGGNGGRITINGGTVTATSNGTSAGIGGGAYGGGGTISISGGNVTATSKGGAGIGGGDDGSGGTITISGGNVMATGTGSGAGIGGGARSAGGTITISGGEITATGTSYGAGIGGGGNGDGGIITISGGKITATGTSYGAGIGGGGNGAGGAITISGGEITATSNGTGAGIGGGNNGESGTFSTGEGGNAVIYAGSIADQGGTSGWSGIIFQGDNGQVYGAPALAEDVTIPAGKTLEVGQGATLTIPSGKKLTVSEPLTNNGTIRIEGTLSVTELTDNGSLTGDGTLLINGVESKLNRVPDAPTVLNVTENSVTLAVITGGAGVEYSYGGGNWQDSPVFTGLAPATQYTFYARYKESNFYNPQQSEGKTISTTTPAPDDNAAEIDYTAETIGFDGAYEMNTEKNFTGTAILSGGSLKDYMGQTLYIRVKAAGGADDSEAVAVFIPTRPEAPTVSATRANYTDLNNGTISGVSVGMEYKLSTSETWTDCAGDPITGLSVGTYLVRVKATDRDFASTAAEVSILPSGTKFETGLKTYNSDGITDQTTFTIDETIIAKAEPTATGEAPAMLAASLDAPGPGQMALFVGNIQVSEAVSADGGIYTMSVSATDLSAAAGGAEQITLTAKYIGIGNLSDAQVTTTVTITADGAAAQVERNGTITAYLTAAKLPDAFTAANNGATVKLLKDVSVSGTLALTENAQITLDLNGKTLGYAIRAAGGELTIINGGTVTGGITAAGGKLTLGPGTYQGGIQSTGTAVLKDFLGTYGSETGPNYAYFDQGGKLITDVDGKGLAGPVTVGVCTEHSYMYEVERVDDNETEKPTHTATCLACGYREEQKHTWEQISYNERVHGGYCLFCECWVVGEHIYDETDPTGSCIVCGLGPVALVERDGALVTAVGLYQLEKLFDKANGAVVTLQRDTEEVDAAIISTPENSACTLDFAGHTLRGVGMTVVSNSSLTIRDSDSGSGGGLTGKLYVYGNAQITGGSFYNPSGEAIWTEGAVLDISGNTTVEGTIGLHFNATRSDTRLTISGNPRFTGTGEDGVGLRITASPLHGPVQLMGGTYSGTEAAIQIEGAGLTLKDLLDEGYAFLNEDGVPIILTEGQTKLEGTVTVGLCPHLYGYDNIPDNFKHKRVCQACGFVAPDEPCTYVWEAGASTGTCAACGDTLTVTVTGAEGLTYNGQEYKPAVTVQHNGATLTEGSDYTVTYANNTNAGTATVTVSSTKFDGAYVQSYGIAKAPPVVAWENNTQEVTYTGQPAVVAEPTVTLVNGEIFDGTNGTIHYSYAASGSDSYTPGLPTNAGSYTVKASVDEQSNYTAAETETPLTLTIEKADAQILTAPAPAQGLVYNKTAQALVNEGTSTFGTVVYALSEDGPYSAEIPTSTNAGAYTVWYKVEGTDNYNGVAPIEVDVTIAKANYTGATATNTSAKYGTTRTYALTALLQDIDGAALGEITTTGGIFEGDPAVSGRALSYTLKADAAPDSTGTITIPVTSTNYNDFNLTITVTVTDKDVPELTVTEITVTYSGGPVPASAIKGTATVDGKAVSGTWSFAEGQAVTNVADSGVKAVKFTPNDTSEYAEAECTVKVTINKATPSGAPKYTAISASGKTLADAGLTTEGGTFSVSGTVAWELADSTEVTANTSYQWIFTPDDFDNYNTLSGSVVLWQRSTGGGGGGGYVPSTPSTGSNLPVSTGTAQGSTVTTAAPTASTQGNTAVAKVDTAMGQEIVKQAKANNSESVVIAPKITGSVTRTEVSLPASTVGQIGNQTNASLTISTPVAGVTIPNGGLASLSGAGGTITVSAEMQGSTVELSVTANGRTVEHIPGGVTLTVPMANTTPGTVAVLVHPDGTQETVRKSVAHNGSVTIPLDGSAKLVIVDNSKQFSDVPATSWAADAIAFASAHELFNGTGGGMFSPDAAMSRGMLAVVLHNLENNPNQPLTGIFADVDNSQWYAEGIAWAAANGIVGGYGNGQFGPNDPITREQLAVMLWRYAGSPAATKKELHFTDADEISDYALNALRWAVENGILNGYGDGRLGPKGQATRAQVAQMLKNFLER